MPRGTKRFRHALALALLAAGAGDAWATRLDKTACADLTTELTTLMGSGLKEDMDKGPAWAAANLSPERLVSINRVVELQGQIEFRCGAPGRNVAKSPNAKPGDKTPDKPANANAATAKSNGEDGDDAAPATKPAQKAKTMRRKRGSAATSPELQNVVPAAATPAAQPPHAAVPVTAPAAATPVKPTPEVQKTAVTSPPAATPPAVPAKPAPEFGKTATMAPPAAPSPPPASKVTPVSTTPQAAAEAKQATPIAPITAPTPAPGQAAAIVAGAQKTAGKKKKASRRDSSSAYVSPKDVNPYSLITGN